MSGGYVGNHRDRGYSDNGGCRDYNNNHQIQNTIHHNKDKYDDQSSEDQDRNGPEVNLITDNRVSQKQIFWFIVGFGWDEYSGRGRVK